MSVNLDKNRAQIISAWKDVLDDKTKTDWALYGYEAQTNDIKVISTGNGGLEELSEDLNSGKIMYAFVRVYDSKTSLTKYLLINWQGEGAPNLRKGTCANHIRDIAKLLTGAHLTINARTEDDIEPDRIMDKIGAVGSDYSFKETRMNQYEQRGPVGTNYSRVIPAKEINSKDRDSFWKKEEEEERRRIELEKERRQQELMKAEKERRTREEREHNERERRVLNDLKSPTVNFAPEKCIQQPYISTQISPTRTMTHAEEMRQQRNHEAKKLIGSRVGTAKAIFSQNSASGQLNLTTKAAPVKPIRNSIAQRINSLNNQQPDKEEPDLQSPIHPVAETVIFDNINEEILSVEDNSKSCVEIVCDNNEKEIKNYSTHIIQAEQYEDEADQYSTIKRSPYIKGSINNSQVTTPVNTEPSQQYKQAILIDNSKIKIIEPNSESSDTVTEDDIIYQDVMSDGGLKAKALYDYQAADESEITFDPGDIITHIDQIDEGWWQGLGPDGTYGLFPANYVDIIR